MKPGPKPGTPTYKPPRDWKVRIKERTTVTESGCWEWQGPRDSKGYGSTFVGSRVDGTRRCIRTHRMAWEAWRGPIPDGMTIDHLCETKPCCNPDHMEVVTNAENQRRRSMRMTHCRRGHERNPTNTRLNAAGHWQCLPCLRITGPIWKRRRRRMLKELGTSSLPIPPAGDLGVCG